MARRNVRFTKHAVQRKLERDISDEQIRQTLEKPDYTISHAGRKVATKRVGKKMIRIVYVEEETHIKIVSVY